MLPPSYSSGLEEAGLRRLWPALAEEAGSHRLWPASLAGKSRLTPALAGFLGPKKPAYAGLRRLPLAKAGFFKVQLAAPFYCREPASSRCSLLHRPPSSSQLAGCVLFESSQLAEEEQSGFAAL